MFHWNIQKYIEEKQLFTLHDKVLVALSGGADSVALLRVLLVLGYHCEAAHCNFHLRGEESDRDERFVNELCKGLGVTLHVTHFDTVAYASRHHVSIEMAAREMRYDWFEQLRKERGMAVIAVAHHRDDSVETFLLNLIRGAEIQCKMYQQAINDINKAVEMTPEDVAMWVEKGSVHLRVGQHNEAIEALEKAISLDPKAAAAYRMLGYCQIQLKKNKEACANFAKAKELGDEVVDGLIQKYCK
jgi:tRNA(Ile)-lysidine synthetase-like protein